MGKYSMLRSYLRRFKKTKTRYVLKDCCLVIEGDSFFRNCYKQSGLNYILGGEFDRYADYLKTVLNTFIESNVTCYVVFTGSMDIDIEKRKEIYQDIIDKRYNTKPGDNNTFYNPIFTKNVHRQVLEELGIWYCVTEYAARQTLLDLSRELNCPVLTYNFEQCLLGMTCVIPCSIWYNKAKSQITCIIQTPDTFKEHVRIYEDMIPLFFTILDENLSLYNKIPEIIGSNPKWHVAALLFWIRNQNRDMLETLINRLDMLLSTPVQKKMFHASIDELTDLIFYKKESSALRYFKGENTSHLKNEKEWFSNGVLTGKIPSDYINIKNKGTFCCSWVTFEESKRDAMLPTLDIVMFAHSLLWDSPQSLYFIGRKGRSVDVIVMPPKYLGVSKNGEKREGKFEDFIEEYLPGFDWLLLKPVPEDCWLLLVTLVYYVSHAYRDFTAEAYSILLSYVMLGPVSEKVGLLKETNIMSHSSDLEEDNDGICTYNDCLEVAKVMMEYFNEGDIKNTFDRQVLHGLAEFQHCLQHVNHLNKLCGKINSTIYYKTYNGTFVFNILLQLRKHEDPMLFFESTFEASSSVLSFYKRIKEVFDNLLSVTNLNFRKC